MIKRLYDLVMDSELNPLRALPKMVRFQYMTILAYMWSVVFTLWVGSIAVIGPTILGHTIILLAIFITSDAFRRAEPEKVHHRDAIRDRRDGTVLYDDVWGAP